MVNSILGGTRPPGWLPSPDVLLLERSSPIAQSLVFDALSRRGAVSIDTISGLKTTRTSGITGGVSYVGPVAVFPGGAATDVESITTPVVNQFAGGLGRFTFETLVNFNTGSGNGVGEIFAIGNIGIFQIKYQDSTNLFYIVTNGWSGSPNFGQYTGLYASINKWIHVAVTCDMTSTSAVPQIYVNGSPLSMGTNSTPGGTNTTADDGFRNMGNDPTLSNARALKGAIAYTRIYNRNLTPGEIVSLYQNPWQVYQTPATVISQNTYNSVSGAINITVPAGTATLTGRAATMTQVSNRAMGAGTATLTGFAPTEQWNIGMPAGALSLSGLAPTKVVNQPINPGVGSLVLSGFAPTEQWNVTVPAGSITLTGLAPTKVVDQPELPAAGTLTLSGLAPAMTQVSNRAMGAGALALSGFAVTEQWNVTVPAGTLSLSGFAPALTVGLNIPVPAGALALSGFAITEQWNVTVPAGSITLTGFAPTKVVDNPRLPGAGTLTLSGAAPGLSWNIAAALGQLVINGFPPTVSGVGAIVVPQGTATLTGLAPGLSWNIAAAKGTLALSTFSLGLDTGLRPGAGALALSGLAPTVTQAANLAPGAGALALSGRAATLDRGITPAPGVLAVSGSPAQLAKGLFPPAGALVLTGLAPFAGSGPRFTPATGSAALSGFAPSIDTGVGIGTAALLLTGNFPSLAQDFNLLLGTGALTLTGYATTSRPLVASQDYIVVCDPPPDLEPETASFTTLCDDQSFITG